MLGTLAQITAQSGGRLRFASVDDLLLVQITTAPDPALIGLWRSGPNGEVETKDGVQALCLQALCLAVESGRRDLADPAKMAARALMGLIHPPRWGREGDLKDIGGVPHTAHARVRGYEGWSRQVQDSALLRHARAFRAAERVLGMNAAGQAALGLAETGAVLAELHGGGLPMQHGHDGTPLPARAHEPACLGPAESAQFLHLCAELRAAGVQLGDRIERAEAQARAWLLKTAIEVPGGRTWARMLHPVTLAPIFGCRDGSILTQHIPGAVHDANGYVWWWTGERARAIEAVL